MTADELLSLAVNVANGWSLEDLGIDQTANPSALKKRLAEVWELVLDANRKAVEQRAVRRETNPAIEPAVIARRK